MLYFKKIFLQEVGNDYCMPFYSSSCATFAPLSFEENLLHLYSPLTGKKELFYVGTADNVTLLSWMWLKIHCCLTLGQCIKGSCCFVVPTSKSSPISRLLKTQQMPPTPDTYTLCLGWLYYQVHKVVYDYTEPLLVGLCSLLYFKSPNRLKQYF